MDREHQLEQHLRFNCRNRPLYSTTQQQTAKKQKCPDLSLGLGDRSRPRFGIGQALFFAAFTFAHRARCAAAIFLRAAADSVRFFGIAMTLGLPLFAFTFAHRAFWAAAILALPAADILPRVPFCFPYVVPKAESAAAIATTSLVRRSCSFFNSLTTPLSLVIRSPSRAIVTGEMMTSGHQTAVTAKRIRRTRT